MRRAIELAAKGRGHTSPNPLVGCVVVKDGKVIAEDYHHKCGEFHAERNALTYCTEDTEGADLYVTLEPCCHVGRTPPCTEIIIEKKIARVFIGSRDPNPKVAGKGAQILREHGIEVVEDFLREECDALNPIFFHYITTHRPYVSMKYAMTLDGKIASRTGASKWITGEDARNHVHILRGSHRAILVGIGTVLADDPMLNCRIPGMRSPVRVVCDTSLRIPLNSQLVATADTYETIVCCGIMTEEMKARKSTLEQKNVTVLSLPGEDGHPDLSKLMQYLGEHEIDSAFIEGGGILHEAALRAGIVNHVYAFIAPKLLGGSMAKSPVEGLGAETPDQAAKLMNPKITAFGQDYLLEYDIKEALK